MFRIIPGTFGPRVFDTSNPRVLELEVQIVEYEIIVLKIYFSFS